MHELGKREHVLRNILLQHSRAESNRRSLDTSSVCGNRTLPDEICFGVRGGQQNELPVSRPDNLGSGHRSRHPHYSWDPSDRLPVHGRRYAISVDLPGATNDRVGSVNSSDQRKASSSYQEKSL
uniref:Uncharacterized protein n=1 Tax=Vespula pensylvanica TaxID=30213 RepID=A0A834P7L0_VESPE|nr:hypothetical protein H0235_004669 [Vespula pensylvanica]